MDLKNIQAYLNNTETVMMITLNIQLKKWDYIDHTTVHRNMEMRNLDKRK